jgi:hypothetical protein
MFTELLNNPSIALIAELMAPSIDAALPLVVIEVSKVGVMISPADAFGANANKAAPTSIVNAMPTLFFAVSF